MKPEDYFKLKAPCADCPFRKGAGKSFRLREERLREIIAGDAFQCHKTVDYSGFDRTDPGDKPRQCAGLIALLHKADKPNTMMQLAGRLLGISFDDVDGSAVYDSIDEAIADHSQSLRR